MDKTEETPDGNEASVKPVGSVINEENNEVMKAIADMKTFFSSKFEGVLNAVQEIKKNRNRRCNLRLVNLPEKVEGKDAANFLEKWLFDVFGASTFPSPIVIERAHRIGKPPTKPQQYPRILIMKFLNFRDRQRVIQAAREMGTVKYEEHKVMFFPDFSVAVRKQRKEFNDVKKRLQTLNISYRFVYPAKLSLLYKGQWKICETAGDAQKCIQEFGEASGEQRKDPSI
ncbi:unnamed protein product [Leuciscus chuanchicus]